LKANIIEKKCPISTKIEKIACIYKIILTKIYGINTRKSLNNLIEFGIAKELEFYYLRDRKISL